MDDLPNMRVTDVAWRGEGYGMAKLQQGARVVIFYNKSVHNPAKSQAEGRVINEDKVYFKSYVPGEQRFEVVDRPANQRDQQMYPREWVGFTANQSQTPEGTPIHMLYPEKPSISETLKAHGVHTVEQAAALSATSIDNIGMGCQGWVNDATKYIEIANKGISVSKFRKELDERDGRIRVMENTINQLQAQITHLQQNSQPVDQAIVQQVLAQMAGGRPVTPANPRSKVFDAQTAQINATSPTAEVVRQKKQQNRRKAGAN